MLDQLGWVPCASLFKNRTALFLPMCPISVTASLCLKFSRVHSTVLLIRAAWRWRLLCSFGGMIETEQNQIAWLATWFSTTWSTINVTRIGPGSKPGLRSDRPATKGLRHGIRHGRRTFIYPIGKRDRLARKWSKKCHRTWFICSVLDTNVEEEEEEEDEEEENKKNKKKNKKCAVFQSNGCKERIKVARIDKQRPELII